MLKMEKISMGELGMDKIEVITNNPIALDSNDHLKPWGTKRDNSKNFRFNSKLEKLYKRSINVLDLGCSGGGFIREMIESGNFGVGIEGSNYSKLFNRGEWGVIKDNLFTADITKEFSILYESKAVEFDVVTMWEVIEHIKEEDLKMLLNNVSSHLKQNGLFIISVSNFGDSPEGVELHETIKPRDWWINKIESLGFKEEKKLYNFFNHQYIRGKEQTEKNFNLIFSKEGFNLNIPKVSLINKILDAWFGSKLQQTIKYLINGR